MRAITLAVSLGLPLLAQTVKEQGQPLRAGCSETEQVVANLNKGDPVKLRFALSGANQPCHAVTVESGGKKLQGYLPADAVEGLEQFDQARRQASASARAASAPREIDPRRESLPPAPVPSPGLDRMVVAEARRASAALDAGRAADALDILEPLLRKSKKDPYLLALAGRAAYQNDNLRDALAYLQESLDLRPEPSIQKWYRQIEKELAADRSGERSYGMRFLLRYDGAVADDELARSMVSALESEFSRISAHLGCRTEERIVTIVQARSDYRNATGAAEWSGGQYDGKIRIPVARSRAIDPETRRTFAHEIVHACIANLGRWPAWIHEGFAQKLSGGQLGAARHEQLRQLARAGKLPKLDSLGKYWGGLSGEQASVHYALALAAVEMFYQKFSQFGARNLMQNPDKLSQIAAELDRGLQEAYGGRPSS